MTSTRFTELVGVPPSAEIVQEPTEQPYGIRDCALRDPAGNMVRVQELK